MNNAASELARVLSQECSAATLKALADVVVTDPQGLTEALASVDQAQPKRTRSSALADALERDRAAGRR